MKFRFLLLLPMILLIGGAFAPPEPVSSAPPTTAISADKLITIRNPSNGTYLLTITPNKVTLEPTTVISPDDDPVPPPPPSDPFVKKVRDAAMKINDPTTSKEIATIYRMLATNDKITSEDALTYAVKWTTDRLLKEKKIPLSTWMPVREIISEKWLEYQQDGTRPLTDFKNLLNAAADGLEYDSRLEIDMDLIMKIIELILEILKLFEEQGLAFPTG